jgi:transposase-like protein
MCKIELRNMKRKSSGRSPVYENSLKVAVAREYLTSNLSHKELGEKFNVPRETVRHFVRWYQKHYPNAEMPQESVAVQSDTTNEKQLVQQLKEANLKIAGLEMLIEIAQKELGVDIVKKPGTKQSPK